MRKIKKRKRGKRGIFFSIDALVALIVLLLTIVVIFPILKYSVRESEVGGDVIEVFSNLKVGEVDNVVVQGYIDDPDIDVDLENTILEQIGEFYAADTEDSLAMAQQMTQSLLDELDVQNNIGIWFGDDFVASSPNPPSTSFENAENSEISRQIISGIERGRATEGFVAKAWLKKIAGKKTSTIVRGDMICGDWGSYCGYNRYNEINYSVDIPASATNIEATWFAEPAYFGQDAQLWVNDVSVFSAEIDPYIGIDITAELNPGLNRLMFNSTQGGEDGASNIVVNYDTDEMQTFTQREFFPFHILKSVSVLHYEKAVFNPPPINSIEVVLNVETDVETDVRLSIRKGTQIIEIGTKSINAPGGFVTFTDGEISTALSSSGINYNDLSNEYFFFIVDIGENNPGQMMVLGEDSYVHVESSEMEVPFGSIDIIHNIEVDPTSFVGEHSTYSNFWNHLGWVFSLPVNSFPILADWQFGWYSELSGDTQQARANNVVLYDGCPDGCDDPYIHAFSRFGYTPSRAEGVFQAGENDFKLDFGDSYFVSSEVSQGYVLYFIQSFVEYGGTFEKAVGGTRNVIFEDESSIDFIIGDGGDVWDPEFDAIDDAVERLLEQLDSDGDGWIDLTLQLDALDIDSLNIQGVPNLWSTEVQVRTWD